MTVRTLIPATVLTPISRSSTRPAHALLIATAMAALAGCGGGGDGPTSPAPAPSPAAVSLAGLAATGTPLAGAAVTAKCSNGPDLAGTTATDGSFTLTLSGDQTAPCIVKLVSSAPALTLYSYAAASGRVNITPLTDLVVARAFGGGPGAAFDGFNTAEAGVIAAALAAAKTYVAAEMTAVTEASPVLDPLTGTFVIGDADDKLLDGLAAAIKTAGKTLDDLLTAAAAGGSLKTALTATPPGPTPAPTPTPTPTPTPSGTSKGILGEALATVFAGDYVLSCWSSDDIFHAKAPVSLTFTVNTDGSSVFDGKPWIDATHSGQIELGYQQKAGVESFVPYHLNFVQDGAGFNSVVFIWKADGSLLSASLNAAGKSWSCPGAGQTVPATTINITRTDFNSVYLKKLARTEALGNCPIGGPQVLTLGNDGAAGIANNSFAADQLFDVKDNSFKPEFTGPNGVAYAGLSYSSGFIKSFSTIRSMLIAFDPAYKTTSLSSGTGSNPDGSVVNSVACQ